MRRILHTYKRRLTNLSQANRSLRLPRLSARRDIDLRQLGFIEKDSPEELFRKILAGRELTLLSRPDPRFEAANLADRRLNQIFREVSQLEEESGAYDLYVGYPFVEGKFLDGTVVRCPVLLFPVRLLRNLQGAPRWRLQAQPGESPQLNRTFFLAYETYQQSRLPAAFWEEEIPYSSDWQQWMNDFYQLIGRYSLDLNFNSRLFEFSIASFADHEARSMEAWPLGKISFQPQAVLGIFPQSDSALLQDYEYLEKHPEDFSLLSLLEGAAPAAAPEEKYVKEEDRYFVTPVDSSQEQALLRIKRGESVVIHGPPGTGKSQVIVNIIADAMAHGRRVLLVSQKRAALDVVYKRLESLGLGRFAMLVHDVRHDQSSIYEKLRSHIEDTEAYTRQLLDLNVTQWEHEYRLLSRQADQYTRLFSELYEALSRRQPCGLSAHELYARAALPGQVLPLREVAAAFDLQQLEDFLRQLRALLDYRELFRTGHPWQKRHSFHRFGLPERQQLENATAQLPAQLQELLQAWQPISAFDLPHDDPALLGQMIARYQKAAELLAQAPVVSAFEQIAGGGWAITKLEKKAESLRAAIGRVVASPVFRHLPAGHWPLLGPQLDFYQAGLAQPLRRFSLKYLKARAFLRRLAAACGYPWNDKAQQSLRQAHKHLLSLQAQYESAAQHPFFADFPLAAGIKTLESWIAGRREMLRYWQDLKVYANQPGLQPVFGAKGFDREAWAKTLETIQAAVQYHRHLQLLLAAWSAHFAPEQRQGLMAVARQPEAAQKYASALLFSLQRDFYDLRAADLLLAGFGGSALRLLEHLQASEQWEQALQGQVESLIEALRCSMMAFWIEQAERQYPVLEELGSRGWPRKQQDYADVLSARRRKVTELVQRRMIEKIADRIEYNRLRNPVTFRQLYHQVTKKRQRWPLRRLIAETWHEGLNVLAPCWMASPESAAAMFPMQEGLFDIVVFDEASQCFVERALPVLLRARQCVIAGDEMQLQPFDLYTVRYEDADVAEGNDNIALEVESLLDLGRRSLASCQLSWHYRSYEEALINFSNQYFYKGKLKVVPPPYRPALWQPALHWLRVQGHWQHNRNEVEADKVVELILQWVRQDPMPSIGVVTFNYHQQELIRDRLDAALEQAVQSDSELAQHLHAAMTRQEEGAFQGLFVKNIENVQGDERDLIIFSIAYAANASGKVTPQFGLLSQKGGENRLNVAVTRARKKIYVVASFEPEQLQLGEQTLPGPHLLKAYLKYVRSFSGQSSQTVFDLPESHTLAAPENDLATSVQVALEARGYSVQKNIGDTLCRIDLALSDPKDPGKILLGIEVEGAYYFNAADTKEREVYRRQMFVQKGWRLHRVWARNWRLDPQRELQHILDLLEEVNVN